MDTSQTTRAPALLKITCGRTAGRQSTRGDKHLLALSSPSRTLGSPVFLFSWVTTTILTVMAIQTSLLPCPKLRFILTLKYLIASRTVASGTKQPARQRIKVLPNKSDSKSLSSFLSVILAPKLPLFPLSSSKRLSPQVQL